MIKHRLFSHAILFLSVMLIVTACAIQTNPVTGSTRLLAYTWDQEKQIGEDVDRELVREYGLYDDEDVEQYIIELGERVLAESHMRREDTDEQFRETEFHFRVLDSPVINAFALPGGYVYVTRGLMAHMNNEAQLAVVIGHEIGHVAARHASQRALQQQLGQVAVIGGAILGEELLGLPGQSIMNLSGQAAQLLFLSYSRDAERESDRLGVEYAAKSGYDAAEGAAFFTSLKRLSEQAGQSLPSMLSTHPNPGEREKRIPELAQRWKDDGYEQTERNTERYYEMIDGMTLGEDPRQGVVHNGSFVHPELEFYFPIPEDWQLINQTDQVVMVSPSQEAVMILRIDSQSGSAMESVQAVLDADEITVNSEQEAETEGGLPAYEADINVEQSEGDLRATVFALEYGDRIYRFINYTGVNRFDTYETRFAETPRSFNQLEDEELLAMEPVRIRVVEADRSDTFRNFLPSEIPIGMDEEDLAIINQVHLDDEIPEGTLLKIPTQ